jgi:diguanylate cyclase (GGDEF)-like protein
MNTKFSADSSIILLISGTISACLIPFCILRLQQGEFQIATLNLVATGVTLCVFFKVYLTNKTKVARWTLSVLSAITLLGTLHLKGPGQIFWLYPTLTTIFYMLSAHFAALVSGILLIVSSTLVYSQVDTTYMMTIFATLVLTYTFAYAFSLKMYKQNYQLNHKVKTDPLTTLGNRRALDETLQLISNEKVFKKRANYTMLLLDIDHFKSINDQFGHDCGDMVLKKFASLLMLGIRGKDRAFRFGGEEFVIILEETKLQNGLSLAENLLKDIEAFSWPISPDNKITASGGIAQYHPNESIKEWLARTDAALYKAKNAGRNKVLSCELEHTQHLDSAQPSY